MPSLAARALVALVLALAAPASARDFSGAEKEGLARQVAAFEAAMRANNLDVVVDTVPPRIVSAIASKVGLEPAAIKKEMVTQMNVVLAKVKITSFGMDATKMEHRALENGTPYALVPTKTVIDLGDGRQIAQSSHSLGVLDEGKWYLLSVDDAHQMAIFQKAYPEFSGVQIPRGTMEMLKK